MSILKVTFSLPKGFKTFVFLNTWQWKECSVLVWTFPYVVKWEGNGLISWLNAGIAVYQNLQKRGKMFYKAIVLHVWYVFLFTVTILFMDMENIYNLIGAKLMRSHSFLHGFWFLGQEYFCWRGKWNGPMSLSVKLNSERNLSWQTPIWMKFKVNACNVHLCLEAVGSNWTTHYSFHSQF